MTDFDNELVQPKSWFNRNWKWAVPVGCLSFIGLFVIGSIILGVIGFTKVFTGNNNVTEKAIEIINHDATVTEKLGKNIETDGMFSGNISTTNDTGTANISVPIKGDKGTGRTIIKAEKQFDEWKYEQISVKIDETGEVIEFQKKY